MGMIVRLKERISYDALAIDGSLLSSSGYIFFLLEGIPTPLHIGSMSECNL